MRGSNCTQRYIGQVAESACRRVQDEHQAVSPCHSSGAIRRSRGAASMLAEAGEGDYDEALHADEHSHLE